MINSILATDMGLHFKYMTDLGNLQSKLAHDEGVIDGWNVNTREEQKDLVCGILIKCADISNVVSCILMLVSWLSLIVFRHANSIQLQSGPTS